MEDLTFWEQLVDIFFYKVIDSEQIYLSRMHLKMQNYEQKCLIYSTIHEVILKCCCY